MTSRNGNNGFDDLNDSDERSSLTSDLRPLTSDLRWYVVQSKPREEERALHFLKEKGFHTYLPRMEVVRVRKFENVKMKQPLFPGYLFCRFDKDENLGHVRWTQVAAHCAVGDEHAAAAGGAKHLDRIAFAVEQARGNRQLAIRGKRAWNRAGNRKQKNQRQRKVEVESGSAVA